MTMTMKKMMTTTITPCLRGIAAALLTAAGLRLRSTTLWLQQ